MAADRHVTDEECRPADAIAQRLSVGLDITDEKHPVPVATWRCRMTSRSTAIAGSARTSRRRTVNGNIILVTWFAGGLRAVDISNPTAPRRSTASCRPRAPADHRAEQRRVVDKARGLVYLIDRLNASTSSNSGSRFTPPAARNARRRRRR